MLLRLAGLSVRFGGVEALSAVDLTLMPGQVLGLMGPNGCGKTTLFNAVSRLVPVSGGHIVLAGEDITALPAHAVARRGVTRTFQTLRLFPQMTVADNVQPVSQPSDPEVVSRALEQVGLAGRHKALAGELSLYEQRRLEIARALARSPRLVLMDEPTAGLAPHETDEMTELIGRIIDPSRGLILIEHKPQVVAALCHAVVLLELGRKVTEGAPSELFASSTFRRAYLGIMNR